MKTMLHALIKNIVAYPYIEESREKKKWKNPLGLA